MKTNKKMIAMILGTVGVLAVVCVMIFLNRSKPEPVAPLPEESPLALSEEPNVELSDNYTKVDIPQTEEESGREKANGTGETAPIVTSHDLAYAQQLAEEEGTPMPEETATMYTIDKANMMQEMSETAKVVGTLAKGEEVQVSFVEMTWTTVVTDDGEKVYVLSKLLSNTPPNTAEAQVPVTQEMQPAVEEPVQVPEEVEVVETPAPAPAPEPQTPPAAEVPPATPSVPGIPAGWTPEEWAIAQSFGATTGIVGGGSVEVVIDPDTLEKSDYNYDNVEVY